MMSFLKLLAVVGFLAACGGEDEMPVPKPCAMWPVVISAGVNNRIDFVNGAGTYSAAIAAGTYYSPADLAAAVETALAAAYAPAPVVTIAAGVNDTLDTATPTYHAVLDPGTDTSSALATNIAAKFAALEPAGGWASSVQGNGKVIVTRNPGGFVPDYAGANAARSAWGTIGFTSGRSVAANQVADVAVFAPGSVVWDVTISGAGRVTIGIIGPGYPFALKFATGANAATSARDVLGFGSVDTASATSATGTNQAQNCWFPEMPVVDDTGELDEHTRAQAFALAGPGKSLHFGTRYDREIRLNFLQPWKWHRAAEGTAHLNESFHRLLANGWARFRWFDDATDLATGTDYVLDLDTAKRLERARVSPATALYGLRLKFRKFV